jgi:hypothetical protein
MNHNYKKGTGKTREMKVWAFKLPFEPTETLIRGINALDTNSPYMRPISRLHHAASGLRGVLSLIEQGHSLEDIKADNQPLFDGLDEFLEKWEQLFTEMMEDKYWPDAGA